MSELEGIISKYFQKDGACAVYYNIEQKTFDKVLKNLGKYERPDILSIFDNQIVGIEHFEFDSFKNTSKGSDFKIKDSEVERNFDRKIKDELKNNTYVRIHDEIKSTSSLENYFNNFKKTFLVHYNKIDEYIQHINEDFGYEKKITMCFFAEDTSPLGSYFLDKDGEIQLLYPIYSNEILELLKKSNKIKYLILGVYAMSEHKLIIIENNENALKKFQEEREIINHKNFMSFSPQTTGYAFRIPQEDLEVKKDT